MAEYRGGGGHQFLMNAYRGGSFTFHIFVCLEKGGYAIFLTLMGRSCIFII